MSGGTFDYIQNRIEDVVDDIESTIKESNVTIQQYWDSLSEEERNEPNNEYRRPWDIRHYPYWISDEAEKYADKKLGLNAVGERKKLTDDELTEWFKRKSEEMVRIFNEHNNSTLGPSFNQKTIDLMKKMLPTIKKAAIYIRRIDWLLASDDGEEEFISRTAEDLKKAGLSEN